MVENQFGNWANGLCHECAVEVNKKRAYEAQEKGTSTKASDGPAWHSET
jgi:hypothetical protein